MRFLLLFCLAAAGAGCTTLENRRDLYRSPREGYEQWFPYPPLTRKPAGPPAGGKAATTSTTTTTTTTATTRHGVITFPEETLPRGE